MFDFFRGTMRPCVFKGLAVCALLTSSSTVHGAGCLKYEPATVALHGKLERIVFPGRPNYESIAGGDEPEAYFYLRLPAPICVESGRGDNYSDVAKSGIRLVQLVLDEEGYKRLRPTLGHSIALEGTLQGAMSGHHHAPVLLTVGPPAGAR